ncbi:cysteine desulfurase [Ruminococcaceae bacterium FB2012]|nr:cysteine desulfurase [Ruminococcaceae bacterium FB2012]
MVYFDNAATTKPCPEAVAAVVKGLECFGNPSSLHGLGLAAEQEREKARSAVAAALGASPEEIVFTSCATESSNTVIFGAAASVGKRKKRIVTTSVEHPSVAACCNKLEEEGFGVIRVRPREDGSFSAEDILAAVDENTCLVTCMLVNNETGSILPAERVFAAVKKRFPRTLTHCDCVQGFMKLPVSVKKLPADFISLSAHKIHGPKGIGALYIRKGVHIPAFMIGGGQEKGFRSGTESVPLIMGFGAACEKLSGSIGQRFEKVFRLRDRLAEKCSEAEGVFINSSPEASPYIVSIAVEGLKSEPLLHFLEQKGIYVSSGSACSKGKKSSVIAEFRVPERLRDSVLRISFSEDNTEDEVDRLMDAVSEAQKTLARIR